MIDRDRLLSQQPVQLQKEEKTSLEADNFLPKKLSSHWVHPSQYTLLNFPSFIV